MAPPGTSYPALWHSRSGGQVTPTGVPTAEMFRMIKGYICVVTVPNGDYDPLYAYHRCYNPEDVLVKFTGILRR